MMRVSEELKAVRDRLQNSAMTGLTMTVLEQREVAALLGSIIQLALSDEYEISFWRLQEARKRGRSMIEDLAGEAMGNMMLDGEAKVVRPDFRKKGGDDAL